MSLYRLTSSPRREILLLLIYFVICVSCTCDSSRCNAGCSAVDARYSSCIYGDSRTISTISSNFNCICDAGSKDVEQNLLDCLSCGHRGGYADYVVYQSWAAVCGVYELSGAAAASSLGGRGRESAVFSYYQASIAPQVYEICSATLVPSYDFASPAVSSTAMRMSTTPAPGTRASTATSTPTASSAGSAASAVSQSTSKFIAYSWLVDANAG